MQKIINRKISFLVVLSIMILTSISSNAQNDGTLEKHGKTLNLGAGIGLYGNTSSSLPVGTINFEFDIARDFTLAPFISFYTYQNTYYWGNPNKPYYDPSYRSYSYRTVYIPIGAKGTYYFDRLFKANPKWDFYAAASLGFVYRQVTWDNEYGGNKKTYNTYNPVFVDIHIGSEYHINSKVGIFLDLSTRVSTFGLAVHF